MITEPIKEKISRWSLERVQFLLSHLEDFIEDDDENKLIRERARNFTVHTDLDKVETLIESDPSSAQMPLLLLGRLALFFDAGLMLQRGPSEENANWWATDIFWRGNVFHLDLKDQVQANALIPQVSPSPLQVTRAPASKLLNTLKLGFLSPRADADAFLIKPTPTLAFVLISSLGAPWTVDHIAHTHRLISKSFIY